MKKNPNDPIESRTRDLPTCSEVPQPTTPLCAPVSYVKTCIKEYLLLLLLLINMGTAVAQWLRRCATNRKVAGSIPDGVLGIFH